MRKIIFIIKDQLTMGGDGSVERSTKRILNGSNLGKSRYCIF